MEIEIISRENIKPSSPTPQNLRNYNLSLLDQFMPPFQFPIVLYFPTHPHSYNKNVEDFIFESTKTLKQSLSKLLTRFYPFAGRVKDHLSLDCNDKGFPFVVSKVKSNLSEFLKKPDQKANCRLIPEFSEPGSGECVAMVQVNYFDCGGMAFGFVFSHKAADGITMCYFIKSWALYASGGCTEAVCPNYIAQNFFPQKEDKMPSDCEMIRNMKIGKTIMRRYVFDSRAISTLKAKSGDIFRPSRVEVVSAFLWKCFMSVNKSTKKLDLVKHLVNLRRRADPPFPDNCFGNWLGMATATSNNEDKNNDQCESNLVRKIRESISNIGNDLIMGLHGDDGFSAYYKVVEESRVCFEASEMFSVTSWCNFGIYNVDFGWGKPVWINNCSDGNASNSPYMNMAWLIDTNKGDGVEAWLVLEEQIMGLFDDIEELRLLASIDPSPLDI